MKKKLLIRDVTLRDGQQSLFATRMSQQQIDRLLPLYKQANFYAIEVWGGAIPDSVMRYLNENPWTRLEKIKSEIGNVSLLTALSRGRNLFGYSPYPDEVLAGFYKHSIESGLNIMRIFDALNDIDNMISSINYVKKYGGLADCAVCYTVDPKFTKFYKIKAKLTGKKLPENLFTINYFIKKARELEKLGADIITIKDMAGLIDPHHAGPIIKELKKTIKVPVNLHTHCTPGYGIASLLVGIVNGVDIVDTAILPFAGGPANPPFEIIQIFADKLGFETNVNLEAIDKISILLRDIRKELKEYDELKKYPIEFSISKYELDKKINLKFDKAINAAIVDNYDEVLKYCQQIEKYFNLPEPDVDVKEAQIPGGMYTNMLAQLKALKMEHLFPRVLKRVQKVRLDCGIPPLVTPTSQIVGVQAVNYVIDEIKGNEPYTTKSNQFVSLVKGEYGKTPYQIAPSFREKICGHKEEVPYDTKNYKKQPNPILEEYGNVKLAENEKEELLLELFPQVAYNFLKKHKEMRFLQMKLEEQKRKEIEFIAAKEAYEKLPDEEKRKILLKGLYEMW